MAWWTPLLDAIKLRARYLWTLSAITFALLFAPRIVVEQLQLQPIRDRAAPFLGAFLIFCTFFAIVRTYDAVEEKRRVKAAEAASHLERARLAERERSERTAAEEATLTKLRSLTAGEAQLLLNALEEGHQTVFAPLNGQIQIALVQKGLLLAGAVPPVATGIRDWPHTIPDNVWTMLPRAREELQKRVSQRR